MHQVVGLSGRYATALYELAVEEKQLTAIEKDILSLHQTFVESADLVDLFSNPTVPSEKISNILETLTKDSSDLFKNFITLILRKKRAQALPAIMVDALALIAQSRGEKKVYVASAQKLSAAQKKEIEAFVVKKHKDIKKVSFEEEVQPELLAGLKVRVDSIEYDATVRGAFDSLRTTLKGN